MEKRIEELSCAEMVRCGLESYRNDISEGQLIDVLKEIRFDYSDFVNKVHCNNNLSSIPLSSDMQQFKDADEKKFVDFIRKDCERKLADVRTTNKIQTVSAFMSIPALIGFLSKLAFYENPEFLNRVSAQRSTDGKPYGIDRKSYVEFVNRFMLREHDQNRYQRTDGLGQVLYKMVRCGLLHGETVGNNDVPNVRVSLSHKLGSTTTLAQLDSDLSGHTTLVSIVLNAEVLCAAIENAIKSMFESSDDNVISSIKQVYVDEPPIIFVQEGDVP